MKSLLTMCALCIGTLSAATYTTSSSQGTNPSMPSDPAMSPLSPSSSQNRTVNRPVNGQISTDRFSNGSSANEGLNPNSSPSTLDRSGSDSLSPLNKTTPAGGYSANNNFSRNPHLTAEIDTQMKAAQTNAKYSSDTANTFKDKEINNKIRGKIEGWFADDYKGVVLKTDNGVVVLSGTIDKVETGKDLADQVRKIDGVREVKNNLTANNNK